MRSVILDLEAQGSGGMTFDPKREAARLERELRHTLARLKREYNERVATVTREHYARVADLENQPVQLELFA